MTNKIKLAISEGEKEFEKSEAGNAFRALLLEVPENIQADVKKKTLAFLHSHTSNILKAVVESLPEKKTKEALLEEEKEIVKRDNWFYNQCLEDVKKTINEGMK